MINTKLYDLFNHTFSATQRTNAWGKLSEGYTNIGKPIPEMDLIEDFIRIANNQSPQSTSSRIIKILTDAKQALELN